MMINMVVVVRASPHLPVKMEGDIPYARGDQWKT